MNLQLVICTMLLYTGLYMIGVHGQNVESFRIPSDGDSCNVVNLYFGRGGETTQQARGPQGPPEKKGNSGLPGLKGDTGLQGEVGPRGITPDISTADVTSAVMKALSATSCEELMEVHGISQTGYYLLRSNETVHPTYNYCDFELRPGATSCEELMEVHGISQTGYYMLRSNGTVQPNYNYCDFELRPGATTCEELMKVHGIYQTGYYLLRLNETVHPTYNYCDFELRPGIRTCQQLRESLADEMKYGNYLMKENDNDQPRFLHCSKDTPKDCKRVNRLDAILLNSTGGVFDIYPESEGESVSVYCDLDTDGGGWTVFQRRVDGSVDFYRGWDDYVNGFGEKDKEFWLGLETIHQLTKDGNYELRVDLTDWSGDTAYAKYGSFSVASRDHNYRLNVGTYSGTAGDSLIERHNNMEFSTNDADHDGYSSGNCAEYHKGAWWYGACHHSNLNGRYGRYGFSTSGIVWYHWKKYWNNMRFTEMKFRKKE